MDVDPSAPLLGGYELKLNSYDLGVDIELADAVARLRFEHPEIGAVVLRSGKDNVFCAGANIRMLAKASHGHKVNFCKFTNETRLAIEDASANSGQAYLAAIAGGAAGGGYELALTAEYIVLADDRRSAVSLPELPLLAVLPGTGGLTRLTDKRKVRRDRADVFCTTEEGVRGKRAVEWRLVDEIVAPSVWDATVRERALAMAAKSDRPLERTRGTADKLSRPARSRSLDPAMYWADWPERADGPDRAGGAHGPDRADERGGADEPDLADERGQADGPRLAVVSERADGPDRADGPGKEGIRLTPLPRKIEIDALSYPFVRVHLDRPGRQATIVVRGPEDLPAGLDAIHAAGDTFWPLAMARQLDDALLHLRLNEPDLGILVFRTEGDPARVLASDALLTMYAQDWLVREIVLLLKRVLKRVDMTARSLVALIEDGSCFAGSLAELAFAADRAVMQAGKATLRLSPLNFGPLPMGNDLTRLATRFLGEPASVENARARIGEPLDADAAGELGLITAACDDIDWDDEVRLLLEERASFSPDALTGLEANLRFPGPETMETRIFGRLTAWQNWIFQRPNAVGDNGSLKRYGTGERPMFDPARV
jgi:benzoyl-CoA-dihydrodiol lyase